MKQTAICVIIALLLLAASAAAVEPSAEILKRRAELQKQSAAQQTRVLKDATDLGQVKMSDIFRIRIDEGRFLLTTDLFSKRARSTFKATVDGFDDPIIIHVTGPKGKVTNFNLSRQSTADPESIRTSYTLQWSANNFHLSRQVHLLEGTHTVTLSQQRFGGGFASGAAPGSVRLTVRQITPGNDQQLVASGVASVSRTATDLTQLRRNHPAEVNEHLRPVLRGFGLDSLLAADPFVAFEVFVDEIEPDAKLAEEIGALVRKLDADSFKDRDAALLQLKALGMPGAVAIRRIDREALSPQQSVLFDHLLSPYRPLPPDEAVVLREDVDFLLDCLYADQPTIRHAALHRLQQALGRKLEFDVNAEADARAEAVDALRLSIHSAQPATRPGKP